MLERLSQKQVIWLIIFALLTFLLPVGIGYSEHSTNETQHFEYRIHFIIPIVIEISQIDIILSLFVSSLGILIPFFIIIHTWLVLRMAKITKGEFPFLYIRVPLLLITLISLVGFFPTFRRDWGNIPLPLMVPIGALFAKFLAKPLPSKPFES